MTWSEPEGDALRATAPRSVAKRTAIFGSTLFRSALGLVAILAAVAFVISAAFLWQTNRSLTQQAVEAVLAEAEVYTRLANADGFDAVRTTIAQRSAVSRAGLYLLQDQRGRRVAGNIAVFPDDIALSGPGGAFSYSDDGGGRRLAAGMAVSIDGGRLLVGRDISEQLALVKTLRLTAVIGFLALAAVGLLGGVMMSRMMLSRVEAMRSASQHLLASDLKGRLPVSGSSDELDRLATSLNDMLERIERLVAGLRDVSENIAHDLKTPLNRLRNTAEAALADHRGEEAYREGLSRVIDASDEIIKTFNALLLIAKLESGALEGLDETVDVRTLMQDVCELYEPVVDEAGFALVVDSGDARLPVLGNRQLIGQALANLIDNAIKYGGVEGSKGQGVLPEMASLEASGAVGSRATVNEAVNWSQRRKAGQLKISAERRGETIALCVADNGPGIPAAERGRVLDRFVRLDESRTKPGTGLGLSLVAAVARLHGGRVQLDDNHPGLKACMVLPVDRRPAPLASAAPGADARR